MSDADRRAAVSRETAKTTIDMMLAIDGDGDAVVDIGIGFFDHMLEAFVKHDLFDLMIQRDGDPHIDDHHTVKDMAIVLGEVFIEVLDGKCGIVRYADRKVLLGEAVVSVAVDVPGRPFFEFSGDSSQSYVGKFTSYMAEHPVMSLAMSTGLTLHVGAKGDNAHHEVKALFKALARSLDDAIRVDLRRSDTPNTKGKL